MCRYGDIRLNLDPQFASQWNTNKKNWPVEYTYNIVYIDLVTIKQQQ